MSLYVLSLDVGTSSVRASLYDSQGQAVPGLTVSAEHAPDTAPNGGVEMDAEALLQRTLTCVDAVLQRAGSRAEAIAGVGVCTFWHSIVGVGSDGRPVSPIVLWADTRSVAEVEELRRRLDERAVHSRTGCVQHTSYVPSKLLWISRHRPEWLRAASYWMSPGEYFFLRLFGERACSVSMASGTGMYDHDSGTWDLGVLDVLPVREDQLSPLVDTFAPLHGLLPEFAARFPQLANVPWFPAAGDGACSNVGSGCVDPGHVALMVGTSGALRVMRNAASEENEIIPPWGLWKYRLDRRRYLVGGALSNGGNLFAWMEDTLQLPDAATLEQSLATTAPDGHGLTMLPFLAGERCPGWRGDARGAIVGLAWSTRPEDLVRAGLEAVAYRFVLIHDLLQPAMLPKHRIVASGGALLASPAWTQIVTDSLNCEVVACEEQEASSRGAALLALEGVGAVADLAALPARLGRAFRPNHDAHTLYRRAQQRQARLYDALIVRDWDQP